MRRLHLLAQLAVSRLKYRKATWNLDVQRSDDQREEVFVSTLSTLPIGGVPPVCLTHAIRPERTGLDLRLLVSMAIMQDLTSSPTHRSMN